MIDKDSHIAIHKHLHNCLDQLVADFISHTGRLPSETTVMEFMTWSHQQTINPDELKSGKEAD